jgi:hypothetical protein
MGSGGHFIVGSAVRRFGEDRIQMEPLLPKYLGTAFTCSMS